MGYDDLITQKYYRIYAHLNRLSELREGLSELQGIRNK